MAATLPTTSSQPPKAATPSPTQTANKIQQQLVVIAEKLNHATAGNIKVLVVAGRSTSTTPADTSSKDWETVEDLGVREGFQKK